MAVRLAGDASTHYRTTDHRQEIDILLDRLNLCSDKLSVEAMAIRVAIDLLKQHDETGCSLDNWKSARDLVERFVGRPIMPNGV